MTKGDRKPEKQSGSRLCRTTGFTSHLFLSQGYVLRGWVDLTSDKPHAVKKSIKYLEQGIQDTKDVLGLMGKVGSGEGRGGAGVSPPGPSEPETHQGTSGQALSVQARHLVDEEQRPGEGRSSPGPTAVLTAFPLRPRFVSFPTGPSGCAPQGLPVLSSLRLSVCLPVSLTRPFLYRCLSHVPSSPVKFLQLTRKRREICFMFCIF